MKQKKAKPRRRWVGGVTLGKIRLSGREMYYFVDDRYGGRMPTTDLEVALWRKAFGAIPYGPTGEERELMRKKRTKS